MFKKFFVSFVQYFAIPVYCLCTIPAVLSAQINDLFTPDTIVLRPSERKIICRVNSIYEDTVYFTYKNDRFRLGRDQIKEISYGDVKSDLKRADNSDNSFRKTGKMQVISFDTVYVKKVDKGIICRIIDIDRESIIIKYHGKTVPIKKYLVAKICWSADHTGSDMYKLRTARVSEQAKAGDSRKKKDTGKSNNAPEGQASDMLVYQAGTGEESFRFSAGDEIEIRFFYTPELNITQKVRLDGKISLQLIGDVTVTGMTVSELKTALVQKYTQYLRNPDITVIPRYSYGNRIYVGGEVMKPGMLNMEGRLSVLDAVLEAGGFNLKTASTSSVLIIRHENGKRYGGKVNLSRALHGKEATPFYLRPGDIVYVPRGTITALTQWIDRNIYSILPPGFHYSKPIKDGTIGLNTTIISR